MTAPPVRWVYQSPRLPAAPEFRLGRAGDDIIAEWIGLGSLHASLDGTRREVRASGAVTAAAMEELLKPHIEAMLRYLQGGVSLHASSVARAGVAVAFLGESCAGKSTIAAQLCDDPEVSLVSDDTVALRFDRGQVAIVPSETVHSLRPDVASALGLESTGQPKIRKIAPRRAVEPVRLGACVALVFDDNAPRPTLRRMRGAEAFSALSLAAMRFVLDDERLLRDELNSLAQVVEQAPVYELRRARDLSKIRTAAAEAHQLLRSLSEGSAELEHEPEHE